MSSMLKLWHFYCLLSVVLVFYQFVEESYVEFESRWIKLQLLGYWRPGRFPGIAGNAGNHGNDGKFHESHKILNQIWRNINKLCLGKISRQKDVRMKFSVDSAFSNMFYGKNQKPGNAGNQ